MTTLERVTFNGPIALHGRIVRGLGRGDRIALGDGTLGPGWELHLHAEWQCVVVQVGEATELVPLLHVRSMVLAQAEATTGPRVHVRGDDPAETARRALVGEGFAAGPRPRGRPRTKQLGIVRD